MHAVLTAIFETHIGIMKVIYRWEDVEILQRFRLDGFSKFMMI
jgi:hypothetical protein